MIIVRVLPLCTLNLGCRPIPSGLTPTKLTKISSGGRSAAKGAGKESADYNTSAVASITCAVPWARVRRVLCWNGGEGRRACDEYELRNVAVGALAARAHLIGNEPSFGRNAWPIQWPPPLPRLHGADQQHSMSHDSFPVHIWSFNVVSSPQGVFEWRLEPLTAEVSELPRNQNRLCRVCVCVCVTKRAHTHG